MHSYFDVGDKGGSMPFRPFPSVKKILEMLEMGHFKPLPPNEVDIRVPV